VIQLVAEDYEDEDYEEESYEEGESVVEEEGGGSSIPFVLALIPAFIVVVFAILYAFRGNFFGSGVSIFLAIILFGVISSSIGVNNEWQKTIILRFGKYNRITGPGLFLKIPVVENALTVDLWTKTMDIPSQTVITKDNISVGVDAVVWLKVVDPKKAVIRIEDYMYSVKQKAMTALRDIIGEKNLDTLLSERDKIAEDIKRIVDKAGEEWGVDIESVEIQNIELPEDMKRVMARQAEAEREKRAVIIKSEGELKAAENLMKAAGTLAKSPGAMELRRLATLSDVSQDQSNTIVFAVPLESLSGVMAASSGLQVPKPKRRKK